MHPAQNDRNASAPENRQYIPVKNLDYNVRNLDCNVRTCNFTRTRIFHSLSKPVKCNPSYTKVFHFLLENRMANCVKGLFQVNKYSTPIVPIIIVFLIVCHINQCVISRMSFSKSKLKWVEKASMLSKTS